MKEDMKVANAHEVYKDFFSFRSFPAIFKKYIVSDWPNAKISGNNHFSLRPPNGG
jgi:hypothetical protein